MLSKLSTRWYFYLTAVLICILSLIAGGYIGARLASASIVNNWLITQTHYLQSHVLILKQLRANGTDSAIEQLEAQLDRDIVSLSPDYYGDFDVSDTTKARIDAALKQAKEYRRTYPRRKQGRAIEQDVTRALNTVE